MITFIPLKPVVHKGFGAILGEIEHAKLTTLENIVKLILIASVFTMKVSTLLFDVYLGAAKCLVSQEIIVPLRATAISYLA